MIKRFDNKIVNERYSLIFIYIVFLAVYIASQIIYRGYITDPYFILLLSIGTIFINFSQYTLYKRLSSADAINFYKTVNENNYREELNDIFDKRVFDIISLLYGIFAGFFVFVSKEPIPQIKLCVSLYLVSANIASGLAVFRLAKFMYYTNKWTKELNITYENEMKDEINFVYGNRDFMVLNTIFYVSVCLTSVLFSNFHIGSMYIFTTLFGILIIVLLYYTQTKNIKIKIENSIKDVKKSLESLIKKEVVKNINDVNYCSNDKIKIYNEILDGLNKKSEINIASILSAILSILLAIIPVLTQFILEVFQ